MSIQSFIPLATVLMLASSCGESLTKNFNYRALKDRCRGNFHLESGDVISINVWNEPNHSRDEILVRPDGNISIPLVGDVKAAGSTVNELTETVKSRLKTFVPNPRVDVSLRTARSYQIYVMGEVQRSGTFTPQSQINVLQALSLAGGFTAFAKRDQIRIIWKSERGEVRIPFNYNEVQEGVRQEQNLLLCRGDTVLVP